MPSHLWTSHTKFDSLRNDYCLSFRYRCEGSEGMTLSSEGDTCYEPTCRPFKG